MRILAAINEPAVARRILECLGLPARAPPLAPAPPPAFDVYGNFPEPPDFDSFDQTPRTMRVGQRNRDTVPSATAPVGRNETSGRTVSSSSQKK